MRSKLTNWLQMGGCLYIIVSNQLFKGVYAIKIRHFEQH